MGVSWKSGVLGVADTRNNQGTGVFSDTVFVTLEIGWERGWISIKSGVLGLLEF